jgi:hypothetical protein
MLLSMWARIAELIHISTSLTVAFTAITEVMTAADLMAEAGTTN